ncbi:general transcription factor IIH subunit 1 [Tetranychus urticae]|uniref:General transcription factor IIH subunit 1 n=1 Tax=Tetranychus urticae TaxID=32264 RepID=T1KEX6_TETUR|nr:general transcription factor IIH subunit 1 [Tetranychus urticae]
MTTSSEDILLLVNGVRNKKNDGTLYLMEARIAWMPNGKDCFTISHKYADIKMQKISPEGKAKVQLQLVLHSGDTTTYHFVSPEGVEKQLSDRDMVKQLLQQLLPKFKKKISKELEEKNRILQEDPDLFNLYKDLVVSGVITSDEFWTQLAPIRCPQLIKTLNLSPTSTLDKSNLAVNLHSSNEQMVGISAAFLSDIKPQADGCNGIKYNITTDIIEAIFRTYPAVKKKHFENVPHKITEAEFWTRFFQSHYFHRDRVFSGSSGSSKGDLFADCAKSDEIDIKTAARRGVKDPFVDITYFDDVDYTNNSSDPKNEDKSKKDRDSSTLPNANQALIKRFNLHSIMILEASKSDSTGKISATVNGHSSPSPASTSSTPHVNGVVKGKNKDKEKDISDTSLNNNLGKNHIEDDSEEIKRVKKQRLKEKTELEDLDAEALIDPLSWSTKESKMLKISNKQRYLEGPTQDSGNHNHYNNLTLLQSVYHQDNILTNWRLSLNNSLSSPAAITALSALSPGGAYFKNTHTASLKDVIPADIQSQLKQLYFSCNELLRHFWACFPVTSPLIEEKLCQMKSTLERFQFTKVQAFHDKLVKDHYDSELTSHLLSQLQLAYNKFNSWQLKKSALMRK